MAIDDSNKRVFRSHVGRTIFGLIGGHVLALLFAAAVIWIVNRFQIPKLEAWYFFPFITYAAGVYVLTGIVNNDIVVFETKIEIVNRIPFFRKRTLFQYSEIKEITLRHDWTETLGSKIKSRRYRYVLKELAQIVIPYNFKWIRFVTVREFKFYCFGIDYDYYDNKGPLFEDLYKELRKKHKFVMWTNEGSPFYARLKKLTEPTVP